MLQEILGSIELQIGPGSFDLRFFVIRSGLLEVGALQHGHNLAFGNLIQTGAATSDAVSNLSVASVGFTAVGFFLIDSLLLVLFVVFACRIVNSGPDLTLPAPVHGPRQLSLEGHRTVVTEA